MVHINGANAHSTHNPTTTVNDQLFAVDIKDAVAALHLVVAVDLITIIIWADVAEVDPMVVSMAVAVVADITTTIISIPSECQGKPPSVEC